MKAVVGRLAHALGRKWMRLGSTLGVLLVVGFVVGSPVRPAVVDWQLYLRVQDELLSKTPEGQRYINLLYAHQDEIVRVMRADPALLGEGFSVLNLWEPNLRALLDGKGGQLIIKRQQVQAVTKFLDRLSAKSGPELQQVIATERARTPLVPLAGLSMDQAYERVIGYPPTYVVAPTPTSMPTYLVTWLPPLHADTACYDHPCDVAKVGSIIPIEFTIQDTWGGHLVVDQSVTLTILDAYYGHLILGPIGIGDDAARAITVHGGTYHYDLKTTGLAAGLYYISVQGIRPTPYNQLSGVILQLVDQ